MALPSSGQITLNEMHVEVGGSSGTEVALNDADIRGLIGKSSGAQMAFNEWYGASNVQYFTISSNQQELNLATYLTNAGWGGSGAVDVTINSSVYIWSNSTSTAGLTISSALNGLLTLRNSGFIIGRGATGGANGSSGGTGGAAISNAASGVTIVNNSGAYIAGGGGGGGAGGSDNYGGGNGGSAGNSGSPNSGTDSSFFSGGGGGGGWGASGGSSRHASGGSGGAAISGTSVSLTNNGTIYGST